MRLIKAWDAIILFPQVFTRYVNFNVKSLFTKSDLIKEIKNEEVSIPECINVKQKESFLRNTGSYDGDYITVKTHGGKRTQWFGTHYDIYNSEGVKIGNVSIETCKDMPMGVRIGNSWRCDAYVNNIWKLDEEDKKSIEEDINLVLNNYLDYDMIIEKLKLLSKKLIFIPPTLMRELTYYEKLPVNPDMLLETMSMCGKFDTWDNTMKSVRSFCVMCKDYEISSENLNNLVRDMRDVLKMRGSSDHVMTHLKKYFQTF